jgi:transcription antitermination factor NusG
MLMATNGNLADVRAALGRDLEVGDVVDYSTSNPLMAELVPGVSPRWHVVEVYRERTAAAHLIARRFGVFVPEKEQTVVRRGRKFEQTTLMFPGYIFVFVWDIGEHLHRIRAVPGVSRVMFIDGKPAILSDKLIDEIRAVENRERPLPDIMVPGAPAMPKKKGRWSNKQKLLYEMQRAQWERDNEVVACRSWSAFQDSLLTLDEEGRNQTLRNALQLAA